MTVFKPSSVFGRQALRNIYERDLFSIQFLSVPEDLLSTDMSGWTWKENWSKYVTVRAFEGGAETLYSGANNSLAVDSVDASPTQNIAIGLYADAGTEAVGAYYELMPDGSAQFASAVNPSTTINLIYTHCAVFIQDLGSSPPRRRPENVDLAADPGLESNLNYFDERLIAISPYSASFGSAVGGFPPGSFRDLYFYLTEWPIGATFPQKHWGPLFSQAVDFQEWTERSIDSYTTLRSANIPPLRSNQMQQSRVIIPNKAQHNILSTLYKNLYSAISGTETQQNPPLNILVELLNVTTTAPSDDSPWSDWLAHRINRFSLASTSGPYKYEPREIRYETQFYYYYYSEIYVETYTGTEISPVDDIEIVVAPPSSGNFTFTHIAVFSTDRTQSVQNGTDYTYPNTDKFMGVIDMEDSVTVESTDTLNRVVPLKLSFMLGPIYAAFFEFT